MSTQEEALTALTRALDPLGEEQVPWKPEGAAIVVLNFLRKQPEYTQALIGEASLEYTVEFLTGEHTDRDGAYVHSEKTTQLFFMSDGTVRHEL